MYRSLFVIAVFSLFCFWILSKPVSTIVAEREYSRMRNIWLLFTVVAFFSPNFWIFVAIVFIVLIFIGPTNIEQRATFYLLLLFVVPNVKAYIPGFGGIQFLFELSYNRLLVLVLLVPLLFSNKVVLPADKKLLQLPGDKYVILFISLAAIMTFRDKSTTDGLRYTFYFLIDIYIPYFILSRHINSLDHLNHVFIAILISLIPIALIGIFETISTWYLYEPVKQTLATHFRTFYDIRAGNLRATTTFFGPIIFGYMLVIGFGVLLYLRPFLNSKHLFYILAIILTVALYATVSRGAWIGFIVLLLSYIWSGNEKIKNISIGIISLIVVLPIIAITPAWDKFIQLLPFVGTVRTDTINYRERLLEKAWIVFQKNPFFGSSTYRETPEMESMRQGQGIIDVTNTYIHLLLNDGLVGLALFLMIFLGLLFSTWRIIKRLPHSESDMLRLGRVLFSILTAILVMIMTVSSIDYVPIVYWAIAGIISSYIYIANTTIRKIVNY